MLVDVFIVVINLVAIFGLAWLIQRRLPEDDVVLFWSAMVFKILAGAALGWIYFEHYGKGDTISYWTDGRHIALWLYQDPGQAIRFFWDENLTPAISATLQNQAPRSLFFVKIAGAIGALTNGNFWMMGAALSFVSFVASWYLVQCIRRIFTKSTNAAAIAFLFWPSTALWSSGLIKESVGLAALFFLGGVVLKLFFHNKVAAWEWLVALLSVWAGWNLKYYWLGVFAPVAASLLVVAWLKKAKPSLGRFELSLWTVVFVLLLVVVTGFHPNFHLNRIVEVVWQNNREFMELSDLRNVVTYPELNPTAGSMILNAPKALIARIFRPFIWEGHNFYSYFVGFENLLLALAIFFAAPSIAQLPRSDNRSLALAIIVYVILLAAFLALSTPNFGTLSRYRIGFMPFLVFLVAYPNRLITPRR